MKYTNCPCGSNKNYAACCGPFLAGTSLPKTPEQLMRSRYTAYAVNNLSYIEATMLPPAALQFNVADANTWAKQVKWMGLKIIKASQDHDQGEVEFKAIYVLNRQKHVLHERSIFKREQGKWFYVDGSQDD